MIKATRIVAIALVLALSANHAAATIIKPYDKDEPALGLINIGNYCNVLLPLGAFALSAYKDDYDGGQQELVAFLVGQLVVSGLKSQVKATRPDGTNDSAIVSGHAMSAFVAAAYLEQRYGWKYSAIPYALAVVTGYSRVYAEKHTWLQVVGGALIGQASAYFFTKPYRGKYEEQDFFSRLHITPMYGNPTSMLTIANPVEQRLITRSDKLNGNFAKNNSAFGLTFSFQF